MCAVSFFQIAVSFFQFAVSFFQFAVSFFQKYHLLWDDRQPYQFDHYLQYWPPDSEIYVRILFSPIDGSTLNRLTDVLDSGPKFTDSVRKITDRISNHSSENGLDQNFGLRSNYRLTVRFFD